MRVNMYQNGGAGAQGLANPDGVATGPIVLTRDPTLPLEAVAKQYVDTAVTTLSASNIISGTLSPAFLPAYSGDATSAAGSATFTLASTGVTPGRYTKFTVDAKGRVTAGSNLVEADLPSMSWSDITLDKPNTLAGFGITDGLAVTGGALTQNLIMSGAPTDPTHVATKGYLDSVIAAGASVSTPTGNIVQMLLGSDKTGFLTCNGASVSKTTYADLYTVIGDTYNISQWYGAGAPWLSQYDFNTTQSAELSNWVSDGSLPTTLSSNQVLVTVNRVFFMGGGQGGGAVSAVYSAPIDASGNIGAFTLSSPLPAILTDMQLVVTKGKVYVIGGSVSGAPTANTWYASINADGTLSSWTAGTSLPATVTMSTSFLTRDRVYLVGGMVGGSISSAVYYATMSDTGVLGAWTADVAFPTSSLYTSANAVIKGRVYIIGGRLNNVPSTAIYYAFINADGSLGTWTLSASVLPTALNNHQVVVTKNKLYAIGGMVGGSASQFVYAAPINADGTLGTFTGLEYLPFAMVASSIAITSSKLYIIGGGGNSGALSSLYSCAFTGGKNDYSAYYSGNFAPSASTHFRLPDLTTYDVPGTNHYIKT